jgi:hypothetical protein
MRTISWHQVPQSSQDEFWNAIQLKVKLDDVEELTQFLGRFHHLSSNSCVFNMIDCCEEAINGYKEITNATLKHVTTPYVSDGVLTDQDYEITGEIAHKASSVLMKLLWVSRLCRPDLAFGICLLAGQVTTWSRNSDKQLFRLVSYLESTKAMCLHLTVLDEPQNCTLDLFCDADLGGCPDTAKSTSGLFLVVRGPNGTFVPLAWHARRQQHVARSTADAELNSLSEGLHEEFFPVVQLLDKLLGSSSPRPVVREDNSAVVAARTPKLSLASLNEACSTWCSLVQTPTADQLGDYFTKCLAPNKFDPSRLGLRIKSNT